MCSSRDSTIFLGSLEKEVIYKCTECEIETLYENFLTDHKAFHSESMHSCPDCDYSSSSISDLIEHKKAHTGEKPKHPLDVSNFECQKCGYQSSVKLDMDKHMKTHTGEKTKKIDPDNQLPGNKQPKSIEEKKEYECNICELKFESGAARDKHIASHNDEIFYKCTECNYECIKEDVLSNHYKNIHNMHTCKECNYKCKSLKALSKHSKTHASPSGKDVPNSLSQKRDCPLSPETIQSDNSNRNAKK